MHNSYGSHAQTQAEYSTIGLGGIIGWSIYRYISGTVSIGALTMIISLSQTAGGSFFLLSLLLPMFININAPRILAYVDFINQVPNWQNNGTGTLRCQTFDSIRFENVSFKYPGNDEYALKNVSFEIVKGEKIAIVGHNGAGKSTLIKLILGYYRPCEGIIYLNGNPLNDYWMEDVWHLFGVCFQNIHRYSMKYRENIAISRIEAITDDEAIENISKELGLCHIYESCQDNLDCNLTKMFDSEGYEPSGGEWQKIGIARTLFRNSQFLVLDEPSAALDPFSEAEALQEIQKELVKKTGIIISHRLSVVKLVNKIIVLNEGQLVEYGSHQELMCQKGIYFEMYNRQSAPYRRIMLESEEENDK